MILINPTTQAMLETVFKRPPHALMVVGPFGIGLHSVVEHFTKQTSMQVTTVLPEKDSKVELEKGTITVEIIRRLYDSTRTVQPEGRIIIIDYAERMAPAAQNAFLKLLEEPTPFTHFILLMHKTDTVLPTITSRAQRIDIRPITTEQSQALLSELRVTDATKRSQLLFIAEGLPAELTRLATDDKYFSARADIMKDARTLATGTAYDRLKLASKYKNSRDDALRLLDDALRLLKMTIAKNGDVATLKMLTRFEVIHKRLSEQGNVRLQLSATIVV